MYMKEKTNDGNWCALIFMRILKFPNANRKERSFGVCMGGINLFFVTIFY